MYAFMTIAALQKPHLAVQVLLMLLDLLKINNFNKIHRKD